MLGAQHAGELGHLDKRCGTILSWARSDGACTGPAHRRSARCVHRSQDLPPLRQLISGCAWCKVSGEGGSPGPAGRRSAQCARRSRGGPQSAWPARPRMQSTPADGMSAQSGQPLVSTSGFRIEEVREQVSGSSAAARDKPMCCGRAAGLGARATAAAWHACSRRMARHT